MHAPDTRDSPGAASNARQWLVALVPFLVVAAIWFSPLSFVPVPWPDDSAFYFAAHELFRWPPRWVMLTQAPFEPTYAIINFNTMPLFPVLIGIGRWVGLDGSHLIKFWALAGFAACAGLLGVAIYRAGLPMLLSVLVALIVSLDPALRWASVVVRPESLVSLIGVALVCGMTLGFPARLEARRFWDPVAVLLAISAYLHFSAIHLLFPVIVAYAAQPRRLVAIGLKTALLLSPWLLAVLLNLELFLQQMGTQWQRLSVPNPWLASKLLALRTMFIDIGNPDPWPPFVISWGGSGMWILVLTAFTLGFLLPAIRFARERLLRQASAPAWQPEAGINLGIPAAWVLGAIWAYHTKPEPWFIGYIHFSAWAFCGLALVEAWRRRAHRRLAHLIGLSLALLGTFAYANASQVSRLAGSESWTWGAFRSYVACIERRLEVLERERDLRAPFRVWIPMYPDVSVELSRRHRDWAYTRHNDFVEREPLALRHGREVDAVVITETLKDEDGRYEGPSTRFPGARSQWLNEKYKHRNPLYRLDQEPDWMPERYLCQRGHWRAFVLSKGAPPAGGRAP